MRAKKTQRSNRPDWDAFWFSLALFYSTRGTCDRLKAACILVDKNKRLIGAGYNGSLPGEKHCDEVGHYMVDGHCIRTLHAEVNAILHATGDIEGATAYVIGSPCIDCAKKLIAKGVKRILYTREYNNQNRNPEHIAAIARRKKIEVKYCDINLRDLIAHSIEVLEGPGGAFESKKA